MKTIEEFLNKYQLPNEVKMNEASLDDEYFHYINFEGKEHLKSKFNDLFPDYIDYFIAGNIGVSEI